MDARPLVVDELTPKLNVTVVGCSLGLDMVEDFMSRSTCFGFDTETNVVPTFYNRKIRTIQVGDKNEQYVIDLLRIAGSSDALRQQGGKNTPAWAKKLVSVLGKGLESANHLKVGTNLQFDYEVTRWCLGMRAFNFYDCLLAEKVIYCGAVPFMNKGIDFWGLDKMIERYCRLIISKEQQKTFDLETPLTYEQIIYGGLDVRLPLSIMNGQRKILDRDGLVRAVEIENGAIMPFGDMHLNGVKLDRDRWMEQVAYTKKLHKGHIEELDRHFIPLVGAKPPDMDLEVLERTWKETKDPERRSICRQEFYRQRKQTSINLTYEGAAAINYGSHDQVLEALQKSGVKIKSTNDKVLAKIEGVPSIKALQAFRGSEKSLDTYGEGFFKHIDPDTDRVHSNISQLGAESGRASSSKPNVQNIPRLEIYRRCFVARPGYKYVARDYDGCELRIIAEESGEQLWIDAFNEGRDVHSICAEMMFAARWKAGAIAGCAYYAGYERQKCDCPLHKKLRNEAKAINFGIPYGMEEAALADKIGCTRKEARALLTLHAKTFVKVHAYLKRSGEFAKMMFEARTACGRRRLFTKPTWEIARARAMKNAEEYKRPFQQSDVSKAYYAMFGGIEREGKNTPIQGGNADLVKKAMGLMWFDLEPVYGGLLVNMIHDEVNVEAPDELAEACDEYMGKIMQEAGLEFVQSVPMTTAGVIAECWQKG